MRNSESRTALTVLQRLIATLLLMSCSALDVARSLHTAQRISTTNHTQDLCPPCELLFSKLVSTGGNGKLVQDVRVQERGEPKSGTGMAYFWAAAALMHTCDYLQEQFGEGSCQVIKNHPEEHNEELLDRSFSYTMLFEPTLGTSDSRCSCATIDRVSIVISKSQKHTLPVKASCAFSHRGGIGIGRQEVRGNPREPPCTFADGTPVENGDDLWRCMYEANCDITDDWVQMAVFRDPRPAIVSTFYHIEVQGTGGKVMDFGSLDDFVARELPILCQWLVVRYTLFLGFLGTQSIEFWYNDAMIDPLRWHYHWFYSVGLQLPSYVVEATARAAAANDMGLKHKDIDTHPGENTRAEGARRFEDEVSKDTLKLADAVLRTWLPPVLLQRFGVTP